ncbi:MAG: WXG100 family type VII secretion target [Firmicutes bacterium]|nr:WXG100 family type VII secretion target [[Eubacterium] siraeum]MCM1487901.1 WXG100 family type VII secretion target [Bacillota bacterium]
MSQTIQVTPEQLETAATKIEGLASDYKSQYDLLYKETGAMSSTWSGKDNIAFTDQIAGFKDDFVKMHTLMMNYVDFLRKSAKSYRETQDSVVNAARKLTN